MRKIAEQPPPKEALKIEETLRQLGFNIHLLGSEKYVLSKLQGLNQKGIQIIKEAFSNHSHTRFMKYFAYRMPFCKKEAYAEQVDKATLGRIVHLIKVCGFLMQTKVYLFWDSSYCLNDSKYLAVDKLREFNV